MPAGVQAALYDRDEPYRCARHGRFRAGDLAVEYAVGKGAFTCERALPSSVSSQMSNVASVGSVDRFSSILSEEQLGKAAS